MNLESQVSSLELAKRLKELGVKQESYFRWWYKWMGASDSANGKDGAEWVLDLTETGDTKQNFSCSAFTVAELYKIHCEINPHACYRFPEGIEPEELANHIAEEIIREKEGLVKP